MGSPEKETLVNWRDIIEIDPAMQSDQKEKIEKFLDEYASDKDGIDLFKKIQQNQNEFDNGNKLLITADLLLGTNYYNKNYVEIYANTIPSVKRNLININFPYIDQTYFLNLFGDRNRLQEKVFESSIVHELSHAANKELVKLANDIYENNIEIFTEYKRQIKLISDIYQGDFLTLPEGSKKKNMIRKELEKIFPGYDAIVLKAKPLWEQLENYSFEQSAVLDEDKYLAKRNLKRGFYANSFSEGSIKDSGVTFYDKLQTLGQDGLEISVNDFKKLTDHLIEVNGRKKEFVADVKNLFNQYGFTKEKWLEMAQKDPMSIWAFYNLNQLVKKDYAMEVFTEMSKNEHGRHILFNMYIRSNSQDPDILKTQSFRDIVKNSVDIMVKTDPGMLLELYSHEAESNKWQNNFQKLYGKESFRDVLSEACKNLNPNFKRIDYTMAITRIFNVQHDSPDEQRFYLLKNFSAQQEFDIIAQRKDGELYNSTFEYIFNDLIKKSETKKADISAMVLDGSNLKNALNFVSIATSYGRGNDLLNHMSQEGQINLVDMLVDKMVKEKDTHIAITLATLGQTDNLKLKKHIEESLISHVTSANSFEEKALFSLTSNLYYNNVGGGVEKENKEFFEKLDPKFKLAEMKSKTIAELTDERGIHTEVHKFYNDDDGKTSYAHYMELFKDSNKWEIKNKGDYTFITSKNSKVKINIYVAKPEEEKTAINSIYKELNKNGVEVQLFAHRGHSTHVDASIENIPPTAQVVFLGSCMGYSFIDNTLDAAPNCNIISTKNEGTKLVNDPIFKEIYERIRAGKDLDWNDIWSKLFDDKKSPAHINDERAQYYVNPAKNKDVRFINTYKHLISEYYDEIQKASQGLMQIHNDNDVVYNYQRNLDFAKEGRGFDGV